MMELTPLDVRKKKEDFRRVVRGYDPGQVDGFLDLVAERLDDLVGQEARLRDRLEAQEEQLEAFRERERALNEALVTAQELREEARRQAERSAESRIREAEQDAAGIRRETDLALREARRELAGLETRRAGLLRALRSTAERFLAELDEEERRRPDPRDPAPEAGGEARADGTPADAGDGGGHAESGH
ncbi:MAG: DivIVA domain-containing protein [Gemmatimonadota bacterium]|nr:DivIVA domain-containing protein [Gemmatimonadota bacterium]